MFYGGKLKAMPPKLLSDDGENIVIRPLAYCKESDIKNFSDIKNHPIIPCDLCGSQENLQRQTIKSMLREWGKKHPGRVETIFSSMQHIVPSHMVDPDLFDFYSLDKKPN